MPKLLALTHYRNYFCGVCFVLNISFVPDALNGLSISRAKFLTSTGSLYKINSSLLHISKDKI